MLLRTNEISQNSHHNGSKDIQKGLVISPIHDRIHIMVPSEHIYGPNVVIYGIKNADKSNEPEMLLGEFHSIKDNFDPDEDRAEEMQENIEENLRERRIHFEISWE